MPKPPLGDHSESADDSEYMCPSSLPVIPPVVPKCEAQRPVEVMSPGMRLADMQAFNALDAMTYVMVDIALNTDDFFTFQSFLGLVNS